MTDQTPAQRMIGDFAPKLVELTDEVLFGDVWARPELSLRDRSLVTCAALVTNGSTEQLRGHLGRARQNGLSETGTHAYGELLVSCPKNRGVLPGQDGGG